MRSRQFGAELNDGAADFRLWAPAAQHVELLLDGHHPMLREEGGWFATAISGARAGSHYRFRIDGEVDVPDPASAFQPDDVFGPSEVIDHAVGARKTGAGGPGTKPCSWKRMSAPLHEMARISP